MIRPITNIMVSVIIPLKELSNCLLYENLPAMNKQTYRYFEVIVLPNRKSAQDRKLMAKYKWLRIIPTGRFSRPAQKRNLGVKYARGKIIAFIDDDAFPDKYWLQKAVEIFENEKSAAVCGPGVLPLSASFWEKVFNEVLKTFIGSGGYSYRFVKKTKRSVDDYPSMNFFIDKKIFCELGGFNNDYWPGEDSKLCKDLVYKDEKNIIYDPSVVVYHHRRNSLKDFLRQHANYGFHRGAFFSHGDENSRRLGYMIPSTFIIYLLISLIHPLFITINYYLFLPILVYLIAEFILFIAAYYHTRNFLIAINSVIVLFFIHFVYGIMFVNGLITGFIKKDNIYG